MKGLFGKGIIAALGLGAVVLAAGCNRASDMGSTALRAQGRDAMVTPVGYPRSVLDSGAATLAGSVVVSCEPGQRTLVRQTVVNGQNVAQVECVTGVGTPAYHGDPVSPYGTTVLAPQAHVVPAVVTYQPAPRPTVERRVVYERAPARTVRHGRSWKKSAVIIGSSAGIGAGVGGAVGGKKGALIGAAIGGGSAAIWDQVTRDRSRR